MVSIGVAVVGVVRRFAKSKAKRNLLHRTLDALRSREDELQESCDEKDAIIHELRERLDRSERRAKYLAAKVRTEKLEEDIPPGKYDQNVTYIRDMG